MIKLEHIENMPMYRSQLRLGTGAGPCQVGDAAMIAGYAGNSDALDKAMARFAFAYADQNEKDFKALTAAAKSKRIHVAAKAS